MASHFHSHRQTAANTAAGLRRDVTWGRILFVPPALAQPHVNFDPLPFRAHEFTPARPRKSPYTR